MKLTILKDYDALSDAAADAIVDLVCANPEAVLCLAAGDTPKGAYALLASKAAARQADFRKATFIGLDEWLGVPPDNAGSCHYFLRHQLFAPLKIADEQIHLFDALATDMNAECRQMDDVIREKGGIDLMLVGVGMNGHIGFNEPGVRDDLYAHVVELDETTRRVGQKYFNRVTTLDKGITLGLRHVLESRTLILIASGPKKAEVIRAALKEPIGTDIPASVVRRHRNSVAMIDRDAAAHLDAGH